MVDEIRSRDGQSELLEQVWVWRAEGNLADPSIRLAAHEAFEYRIRVQVHRDFYPGQSYAKVSVLTPALEWTELAVAPPGEWHAQRIDLAKVAMDLANRARAILPWT
jgi:hypothetical protein